MRRYGSRQIDADGRSGAVSVVESGVVAFLPGDEYIDVEFRDGRRYRYSYAMPGRKEVERMKELAEAGKGLTTFINKYVRDRFAVRLR